MSDGRLATEIWVAALLRRWNNEGFPAVLLRRGDPQGGTVILRVAAGDGTCRILSQTRDPDGAVAWIAALNGLAAAEADADAYVERSVHRDPDLWVVEVEDRKGKWLLDGKLLS